MEPRTARDATATGSFNTKENTKDLDERELNAKGVTLYKAVVGALQWIITQGRPDFAGELVALQGDLAKPKWSSIKAAKAVVEGLNATTKQLNLQC